MKRATEINRTDKVQSINQFLKFNYCFPFDIKERFITHFGESLGNHFYEKFQGFTKKHGNNYIGMIYTFSDMTTNNQLKFIDMIDSYDNEKENWVTL